MKRIDAHNGFDTGFFHHFEKMKQVFHTLLQQTHILLGVLFRERFSRHDLRTSTMHLHCSDCCGEDRNIWMQTTQTALDIPELLKSDISCKSAFSYMIVEQFQSHPIGDYRGLSHSNICKGTGVYETGLILNCACKCGIDRIPHPCCHGTSHFEIIGSNGLATLVIGDGNIPNPLTQVFKIPCNREYCHEL